MSAGDIASKNGFAEVNGSRLYYEVAGSGYPLVLMHGFSLDTRMWDDQFLVFAQHYRVIRYDARGYGKSALPTAEAYSAADDLKALLTHLQIEQAHILGLSMGGGHAINFALSYPQATKTLIIVDSVLGGYQWEESFASEVAPILSLAKMSGIRAAKAHWFALDLFASARNRPAVAVRLEQMIADYSGWHWLNDDPEQELEPPPIDQLDGITAPTLAVVGEHDLPDFHKITELIEQNASEARKIVIRDAGHMANMEQPGKFNQVVLEFLQGK